MEFDKELAKKPNKYATTSGYLFENNFIRVNGYQNFSYSIEEKSIYISESDQKIIKKTKLVEKSLLTGILKDKSVLDLGGNNGFFSLLSLINGARNAHVVDIDSEAIKNVRSLSNDAKMDELTSECSNISEVSKKSDIVLALALVHWIFDLTTGFGSLKSAIKFLKGLTKEALIIEWVDPNDPLIINYKHTSTASNSEEIDNYNEENFINLLRDNFDTLVYIGSLSNTRKIYLAYDELFLLKKDLDWASLIHPFENIISSKALCLDPTDKFIYSRVYELEDKIIKQTSLQVGKNERNALNSLNHPSIPKLLSYREELNYSVLEIEKKPGQTLTKMINSSIRLSDQEIKSFSKQLFSCLSYIHSKGVEHRDIHPGNLIWCNLKKKIYIIDFGWAHVKGFEKIFTPKTLGQCKNFYPYIDPSQARKDNYSAAIIISTLVKDRKLDEVEEIISELILDLIKDSKSDLKNFILSIQNLQRSIIIDDNGK